MNKTQSKNAYAAKAYDRLSIFVRKGMREIIRKRAAQLGMSVNRYAVGLILRDLGE